MLRLSAYEDLARGVRMRFHYSVGRLPAAMSMDTEHGPEAFALGYDQVGSLRAVADATGGLIKLVQYDSFGNVLSDTAPGLAMPFGFAGGVVDRDTGLIRFGRRDYDPYPGRFTAPDPLGYTGRDPDLYEYAVDDPINVIDPTGEEGERLTDGERHSESGASWNTHDHSMPGALAPGKDGVESVNLLRSPELAVGTAIAFAPTFVARTGIGAGLKHLGTQAARGIAKAARTAIQATDTAGAKINETTWKAMEKGLQTAPVAMGKVLDPGTQEKVQPIIDFTTSALPGGAPANSVGGVVGGFYGKHSHEINKSAQKVLDAIIDDRNERIRKAKIRSEKTEQASRKRDKQ